VRIILPETSPPPSFDVVWDAAELKLPDTGRVRLEAFSSGSPEVLRFDWGTVAEPTPPKERGLTSLPGGNIAFNFKVVDFDGHRGRLLGIAQNIRPIRKADDDSGRQSLLPVDPSGELGEEVWRLKFMHNNAWLQVNNKIPNIMDIARTNETFFALVYPAVLRQIFFQVLIIDQRDDADEDDEWHCKWLRWGRHWHPDKSNPPENVPNDHADQLAWIEAVVGNFAEQHQAAHRYSDAFLAKP
jgi:hypothetical protein